jgi:hypothetical protein
MGKFEFDSNHQLVCRNHVEEVVSPVCLRALSEQKQVLTGHMKGLIKLFDVGRPSAEAESHQLKF